MTLDESIKHIETCMSEMTEMYGETVFDEWALIGFLDHKGHLLHYAGPRKPEFQANFSTDIGELRDELKDVHHSYGEFFFEKNAIGTKFDAIMVMGEGLFLICNNTGESMSEITANTRWLSAQKAFLKLSEKFRTHPLSHPM